MADPEVRRLLTELEADLPDEDLFSSDEENVSDAEIVPESSLAPAGGCENRSLPSPRNLNLEGSEQTSSTSESSHDTLTEMKRLLETVLKKVESNESAIKELKHQVQTNMR